jgi:hypothetical protein
MAIANASRLAGKVTELVQAVLESRVTIEKESYTEVIGTRKYPKTRYHIEVAPDPVEENGAA